MFWVYVRTDFYVLDKSLEEMKKDSPMVVSVCDSGMIIGIGSQTEFKLLVRAAQAFVESTDVDGADKCGGCHMYHRHKRNCLTRRVKRMLQRRGMYGR